MRLSISNIAWTQENDNMVYDWLRQYGYSGLEIAPNRILPENPYARTKEAKEWAEKLQSEYGLVVPSMQSIWYGRQEKIFGTQEERQSLIDYTKKAIDFAEVLGCRNLVFGCPRNRSVPDGGDASLGIPFFKEIGDYAAEHGTVIAIEGNPPIYNTNYIKTTEEAINLIEEVNSPGFRLNLDTGTMIENREPVELLSGKGNLLNHVHISEPGLKPIEHRNLHRELRDLLIAEKYPGFVSIEMGKTGDTEIVRDTLKHVAEIFG